MTSNQRKETFGILYNAVQNFVQITTRLCKGEYKWMRKIVYKKHMREVY